MTPNPIAQLILDNDHTVAADTGDSWDNVFADLFDASIDLPIEQPIAGKATLLGLTVAGHDTPKIIDAFRADSLGNELLNTLNVNGVHWNDPLTKIVVEGLVAQGGDVTQAVADTLTALSVRKVSKAMLGNVRDTPSIEELARHWRSFRLEQRIENTTSIFSASVSAEMSEQQQANELAEAWTKSKVTE